MLTTVFGPGCEARRRPAKEWRDLRQPEPRQTTAEPRQTAARETECEHVTSAAGPLDDEEPVGHVPAYDTQARRLGLIALSVRCIRIDGPGVLRRRGQAVRRFRRSGHAARGAWPMPSRNNSRLGRPSGRAPPSATHRRISDAVSCYKRPNHPPSYQVPQTSAVDLSIRYRSELAWGRAGRSRRRCMHADTFGVLRNSEFVGQTTSKSACHRTPVASDGPPAVRPARAGDRRPVGDPPALSSGATDRTHIEMDSTARGGAYGLLAAARHETGPAPLPILQHRLSPPDMTAPENSLVDGGFTVRRYGACINSLQIESPIRSATTTRSARS